MHSGKSRLSAIVSVAVWPLAAELGEGPVWVQRDRALWFVDIKRRHIHRYDPATGDRRSWDAPDQIGFLFPARDGGFLAGLKDGLHRFDEATGRFVLVVAVGGGEADIRLNDGVVDRVGRLWFGTMDDAERAASGAFYCFADGQLKRTAIGDIAITNGPAVSPDGRWLYVVDTLAGAIDRVEILDDGTLGARQPFVRIPHADGHPDGPTVDSEGCVWVTLYGGWQARRYSPAGELLGAVRFPVANITKLAFGGDDLRTVFATTARQGLSDTELRTQPLAGALFEFRAEVPGVACPELVL